MTTKLDKKALVAQSWQMHGQVEQAYLDDPATKGDELWLEKQRLLLADMALHLLQTSLNSGELDKDKLTNNLHSIMTIADQFLPEAELAVSLRQHSATFVFRAGIMDISKQQEQSDVKARRPIGCHCPTTKSMAANQTV